jgi:hypothetical protein
MSKKKLAGIVMASTAVIIVATVLSVVKPWERSPSPEILETYTLATASTAGGSVTIPGQGAFTYHSGTVVNLMAEADEGYYFVSWTGDVFPINDINASSTTITMICDCVVAANFASIVPSPLTLVAPVFGSTGVSVRNIGFSWIHVTGADN